MLSETLYYKQTYDSLLFSIEPATKIFGALYHILGTTGCRCLTMVTDAGAVDVLYHIIYFLASLRWRLMPREEDQKGPSLRVFP